MSDAMAAVYSSHKCGETIGLAGPRVQVWVDRRAILELNAYYLALGRTGACIRTPLEPHCRTLR